MKGAGTPGDRAPAVLLAKALYDNHPDCAYELAFCKGDILTVLEQDVPESEGWWQCVFHGRQGLAPANRLQVLTEAPADRSCPPLLGVLEAPLVSSEKVNQVATRLSPPSPGPIYEHMRSWVEGPLPSTAQVYELPDPSPSARIISEKILSFPRQTSFSLPQPTRASLPAMPSQVYDVPAQSRVRPAAEKLEKNLYDVPASPQKAALQPSASQAHGRCAPPTSLLLGQGGYTTLPSPQKAEWIYDTPVSPQKASVRHMPLRSLGEESGPQSSPRLVPAVHGPSPDSQASSLHQKLYKNVPRQKKLSLPEIHAYGLQVPRDMDALDEDVSYKVPSSFLIPRVEQQNTKPNIYDIPKAKANGPQGEKELEKADRATEMSVDRSSTWLSSRAKSSSPEPDTLSVSSSDSSRASVVSSCSSTSTDSSSSSCLEESAKEFSMDLNMAKETVTVLQHKVAGAVASLTLFVSRNWRLRESLQANLEAVHQAADRVQESLKEFLNFAQGIQDLARQLANSNLQARFQDQLQTISCSYQTLLEAKSSLDSCRWSLEALVTDKTPNDPDDLERFVMVARTVPEDIKKFASMLTANGRLLYKQNCKNQGTLLLPPNAEFELKACIQAPQRENESDHGSTPFKKQREKEHSPELVKKNRMSICGQKLPNLKEKEKPILKPKMDKNKDLGTKNPSCLLPQPLQYLETKIHLSEHCRLYFGALFKAISVFTSSLSNGQPPETFITQSKLIIMVGQKLVDTLCQETQERDARNEILTCSSHLCSLLRNLALATKDAVLQYPSPEALRHLQAETKQLEEHAWQFRGALG